MTDRRLTPKQAPATRRATALPGAADHPRRSTAAVQGWLEPPGSQQPAQPESLVWRLPVPVSLVTTPKLTLRLTL